MEGKALVSAIPAAVVDHERYVIVGDVFQETKFTDEVLLLKRDNALIIIDVDSNNRITVSFDGLKTAMEKLIKENS